MCDEVLWRHQVEYFSPQRDVLVMDLVDANSMAELAQQVLQKAPPSFALAGLSMGAILAFEVVRQAPERVAALALLDCTYLPDTPEKVERRNRQISDVRKGHLPQVLKDELKPNYLAKALRQDQDLLDEIMSMGLDLGDDVFVSQSLALRDRIDSTDLLPNITCPSLVLCGDEDELCPIELHQTMAQQIPNASLKVIASCGHLASLERPDAVNAAMDDWLHTKTLQ